MTETNTDDSIDVEPTESVAQNDADELSEQFGIDIQLIDEGLDHEDDEAALEALRDEIDPENSLPKSIHMTVRDEGVNNYFWVSDDIETTLTTEVMCHLANHLQEASRCLQVSPAAAAFAAADVVDTWNERNDE